MSEEISKRTFQRIIDAIDRDRRLGIDAVGRFVVLPSKGAIRLSLQSVTAKIIDFLYEHKHILTGEEVEKLQVSLKARSDRFKNRLCTKIAIWRGGEKEEQVKSIVKDIHWLATAVDNISRSIKQTPKFVPEVLDRATSEKALDALNSEQLDLRRTTIIAELARATEFDPQLFSEIPQSELDQFIPIVRNLLTSEKTPIDIHFSLQPGDRNFAHFSRKIFKAIPKSLSLVILGEGANRKLHVITHVRKGQKEMLEPGSFKDPEKIGPIVVSRMRQGEVFTLASRIKTIELEENLRNELSPEELTHFHFSEKVIYKTPDLKKDKSPRVILISRYMNQGSLENAMFHLPADQVISIFLQIAKGIECMHRHNMVHSDLHLGNILIEKDDGGQFIAKVSDFDRVINIAEKTAEQQEEIKGSDIYQFGQIMDKVECFYLFSDETKKTLRDLVGSTKSLIPPDMKSIVEILETLR